MGGKQKDYNGKKTMDEIGYERFREKSRTVRSICIRAENRVSLVSASLKGATNVNERRSEAESVTFVFESSGNCVYCDLVFMLPFRGAELFSFEKNTFVFTSDEWLIVIRTV